MVTITFESHATTIDNEAGRASGWNDVALSKAGEQQACELGKRRAGQHFDAIFCSDLQRAYKTAELAFGNIFPIIRDKRMRECDYGSMTLAPRGSMEAFREQAITKPFPGGESYQDSSRRMRAFLQDLLQKKEHLLLVTSFPRSVNGYAVHYVRILLAYQLMWGVRFRD